ncbi:glycoside hydrolase family 13 protein [Pluteus cervinus]|uniref:Glycoside hydrolase family 13 protein n=1 Tax=Pluteus cervinus TaxID=181527 RepID=A0ACD3BC69_9AGAR|nr:glycoside hydrolase family 13 protein [Pluteus cervinus]
MSTLVQWLIHAFQRPTPALSRMQLGPEGSNDNPLMLQFFTWDAAANPADPMSWWRHFENEIPKLAEMGFTQVWLPPPNKAAVPSGRGYDAYDLWDLGEFQQKGATRTRWGTKEEFIQACKLAGEHRIGILIDAVLNHKLGADRTETFQAMPVDPSNRLKNKGRAREIEGWTVFDFQERRGQYSTFQWTQEHFTGVDWDHRAKEQGVYRITGKGHKGWSKNVAKELGNYDYLLGIDIDHRHPDVQNDLLSWGTWILETTGAVGFRLDAIKHMDRLFLLKFLKATRERSGNSRMFAVSEYWSGNLKEIIPYIQVFRGESSFFDVPLHMNFSEASKRRNRYDLRTIFDNTVVKTYPNDAVTFVDNHDTVEGQSLESWVEEGFKAQAYALILLRNYGYPCVFYGDLYPGTECSNANNAQNLRLLIEARKKYAYGGTQNYFQERNCIGFVRMGDSEHPGSGCAVLVSNKETSGTVIHSIKMNVGLANAKSTFRSFMTQHGQVEIDEEGWGTFTCFANHVQVWVRQDV